MESSETERIEKELAACLRNHERFLEGRPKIASNNCQLRSTIVEVISEIRHVNSLAPVVEELRQSLLPPCQIDHEEPQQFRLPEEPAFEGISSRIIWLEAQLKSCAHINFSLQTGGAWIIRNSDVMRQAMRKVTQDIADNPELKPIIEKLELGLKKASD